MLMRLLVAIAAMAVSFATAADTVVVEQGKLTGTFNTASVDVPDPGRLVHGSFLTVVGPGGDEAISAYYSTNVLDPVYNEETQCTYGGLFPMSAVKVTGTTMVVDFRHGETQCWVYSYAWNVGWYISVPTFDFTGTFSVASGMPSYTNEQDGTSRITNVWSCGEAGCTNRSVIVTNGSVTERSATFDGTIGGISVEAPSTGYNAVWTERNGQHSYIVTRTW